MSAEEFDIFVRSPLTAHRSPLTAHRSPLTASHPFPCSSLAELAKLSKLGKLPKVKVLRIIARLNVGGPARHVVWLTDALNDGEFESVLIAGTVPPTEEDMGYFADDHGVRPVFIEEMSRELSPQDAVSLWKVWKVVRREKPDVIHTHTAKAGTIGRTAGFLYKWLTPGTLIGRPRKVRVVHTYHGHIFHSYYGKAKTRLFLFIERTLGRFATDRIVAITEQQRKEINEDFRVGNRRKFEVVPLGIDLSVFADAGSRRSILRDEIGASEDDIVVGIVGRLTEIKDHELFLRAVAEYGHEFHELHEGKAEAKAAFGSQDGDPREHERAHGEHGEAQSGEGRVRFAVIGDGHLRGDLEALAEELGISDRVVFLGNREDPEVFYAGLDVVALTSKNEGTPLSLIEGMANRLPVVATAVGGVVDLLGRRQETGDRRPEGDGRLETGDRKETGVGRQETEDRTKEIADSAQSSVLGPQSSVTVCERGIAVTSRVPADFAAAIRTLVEDPDLRERLANEGYEFVKAKYDKSRLVEDIKRLYRKLSTER